MTRSFLATGTRTAGGNSEASLVQFNYPASPAIARQFCGDSVPKARFAFAEVIPVSALRDHNLDVLEKALSSRLPEGDFWFDDDQLTDRSLRFMAAEIIREKVVRQLGQEVPHQITVEIDIWEDGPKVTDIAATILVERRGQKKILIGDKGSRIKSIGTQAREDMERLIDRKVMLTLWVKIKAGWSDDERALRSLGYDHR